MDAKRRESLQLDNAFDILRGFLRTSIGPGINKVSEITTHLYISNAENAHNTEYLREYGFKTLICTDGTKIPEEVIKFLKKKKITFAQMIITVSENLMDVLEKGFALIHDELLAERKVLIFCRDGAVSSPILVAYYLLRRVYSTNAYQTRESTKKLMDLGMYHLLKIIKFIKEARPCIDPNVDILKGILRVEQQMKRQIYNQVHENCMRVLKENPPKKSARGEDASDDEDIYDETVDSPEREVDIVFDAIEGNKKKIALSSKKKAESDSESEEDGPLSKAMAKKAKQSGTNKNKRISEDHDDIDDLEEKTGESEEEPKPVKKEVKKTTPVKKEVKKAAPAKKENKKEEAKKEKEKEKEEEEIKRESKKEENKKEEKKATPVKKDGKKESKKEPKKPAKKVSPKKKAAAAKEEDIDPTRYDTLEDIYKIIISEDEAGAPSAGAADNDDEHIEIASETEMEDKQALHDHNMDILGESDEEGKELIIDDL